MEEEGRDKRDEGNKAPAEELLEGDGKADAKGGVLLHGGDDVPPRGRDERAEGPPERAADREEHEARVRRAHEAEDGGRGRAQQEHLPEKGGERHSGAADTDNKLGRVKGGRGLV